jgi:hypothetical protein
MTKEDVLKKIKEANDAIDNYSKPFIKTSVDESIIEAANELFEKRAYILGSSGNTCPTCAGSGRI